MHHVEYGLSRTLFHHDGVINLRNWLSQLPGLMFRLKGLVEFGLCTDAYVIIIHKKLIHVIHFTCALVLTQPIGRNCYNVNEC